MKWVENAWTELQTMVMLARKCGPAWKQLARGLDGERSLRPAEVRKACLPEEAK